MTMLAIVSSLTTSCQTPPNPDKLFNRDGIYVISRAKGKVELYSKDRGTNTFSYYGWVDTSKLEGDSIHFVDWSKEQ